MHTRISVGSGQACLPGGPRRGSEVGEAHQSWHRCMPHSRCAEQLARVTEALNTLLQMQQEDGFGSSGLRGCRVSARDCLSWPAASGTDVAHLMSRSQLARGRGRGGAQ
jgi:hypothetical protein